MTALARNDSPSWVSAATVAREFGLDVRTVRTHYDELGGRWIGRQLRFPANVVAPTIPTSARGAQPDSQRIR